MVVEPVDITPHFVVSTDKKDGAARAVWEVILCNQIIGIGAQGVEGTVPCLYVRGTKTVWVVRWPPDTLLPSKALWICKRTRVTRWTGVCRTGEHHVIVECDDKPALGSRRGHSLSSMIRLPE